MSSLTDLAEEALGSESALTAFLELVAIAFELAGVGILAVGSVVVAGKAARTALAHKPAYSSLRRGLGRVLLLGLEVLVAADIVRTVAVETTLESVVTLALLVVVRTVLSFALAAEIEGVVPWRRRELEATLRRRRTDDTPERDADADDGEDPEEPHG